MRILLSLSITLVVAGAVPATVHAQDYVQAPCAAAAGPAFQDNTQALWYRRFWTGDCRGLPLRCMRGKPNWNDMVRYLAGRAPAERREAVTAQACRMGREIGFEWSRPNAVRRIDTDDLRAWNNQLQKAGDVVGGLAAVEAGVRARIGR